MKRILTALAFLAIPAWSHAQRIATTETATEFISPAAFDAGPNDDLAVLDRASGVLRIGMWNGSEFTWTSASGGIEDPDWLCVGNLEFVGGPMSVAVGGAAAQRMEIYTPSGGHRFSLGGLGVLPSACVVKALGGSALDDFAVASQEVLTTGGGLAVFVNEGSFSAPTLGGSHLADRLVSGNPVSQGAAFLTEAPAFEIWSLSPGNVQRIATLGGLPPASRHVAGLFGGSGQDTFMLWVPGQSTFEFTQLGGVNFMPPDTWDAGMPIGRLQPVSSTVGISHDWLLAISQDGMEAKLFDFTPATGPVLRQSFAAPPGSPFTAATSQTGGNFILLNGPNGITSGWQRATFDGMSHTLGANSALPSIHQSRVSPTVFLYTGEPWVQPAATLASMQDIGDWTTDILPGMATTLSDLGVPTGLGSPSTQPASGIGAYFAQPNQISPAISIASLSPTSSVAPPVVILTPPPGIYPVTVNGPTEIVPLGITLSASGGSAIRWRLNGGSWQNFNPDQPPQLVANGYLEAFVADVTGGPRGPVAQGNYIFGPLPALTPAAFVDADNDGLSDTWEKATGVTNPSDDKDGDGFTNLQEQLAGTDPCDVLSIPSSTTDPGNPKLFILASSQSEITLRLTGTPGVTHQIEKSANLAPSISWVPHGGSFAMPNSGNYDFVVPIDLNTDARLFYRGVANP